MALLTLLLTFTLTAFAAEKPLFSSWRSASGTGPVLDLQGGDFRRNLYIDIKADTLVTCDCFVWINGDESRGSMRVSSCIDRAGNYDRFNCKSLEGIISYSKSPATLRLICVNRTICRDYR